MGEQREKLRTEREAAYTSALAYSEGLVRAISDGAAPGVVEYMGMLATLANARAREAEDAYSRSFVEGADRLSA